MKRLFSSPPLIMPVTLWPDPISASSTQVRSGRPLSSADSTSAARRRTKSLLVDRCDRKMSRNESAVGELATSPPPPHRNFYHPVEQVCGCITRYSVLNRILHAASLPQ